MWRRFEAYDYSVEVMKGLDFQAIDMFKLHFFDDRYSHETKDEMSVFILQAVVIALK